MKRRILFIICLVFSQASLVWGQGSSVTSQSLQSNDANRFSADWRLRLAGFDVRDDQSQSKIIDFHADFQLKYLLSSSMTLDIQPSLKLQNGTTQSFDGAEKADSKILLGQAAVHILPISNSRISLGALNQRYTHTALLVDSIPFPSARGEIQFKMPSALLAIIAESAIPTSTSLSTNTKELEPTPTLNSLALQLKSMKSSSTKWKSSIGYFAFSNLPSSVAEKSSVLGNEVTKVSDAQYLFNYQFEGFESSANVEVPFSNFFSAEIGAEYLTNNRAPGDVNKAYSISAHSKFHLSKNHDMSVGGQFFVIDPDAAISYFNAFGYETNRMGYSVDGTYSFNKEGFSVGFKYIEADAIYSSASQSRQKTFLLKLETSYAKI